MRALTTLLTFFWGVATLVRCTPNCSLESTLSGINPTQFDTVLMGQKVGLYTLTNESGMEMSVTNFGARIVSVMVEDRDGDYRDVVLGFDNIKQYLDLRLAIGATVGRYAGRIPDGRLVIDGVEYNLPINDAKSESTLHGGAEGWMNEVFEVESVEPQRITMSYRALDGENGFPGDVDLEVSYTLREDNAIEIEYDAKSSKPTLVNLTNHSFFNLDGDSSHAVCDNMLWVDADSTALIDTDLCRPTGERRAVEGTPMDLRKETLISERVDSDDEQISANGGLDHLWFLNHDRDDEQPQARLYSPNSGIALELYTTQSAVHIFSANFFNSKIIGRNSRPFVKRGGLCFETQHALDVPELHPGGRYKYNCVYKFVVE